MRSGAADREVTSRFAQARRLNRAHDLSSQGLMNDYKRSDQSALGVTAEDSIYR